jgi:hypothetical protein
MPDKHHLSTCRWPIYRLLHQWVLSHRDARTEAVVCTISRDAPCRDIAILLYPIYSKLQSPSSYSGYCSFSQIFLMWWVTLVRDHTLWVSKITNDRSCARHELGLIKKKRIVIAILGCIAIAGVSAVCVYAMNSQTATCLEAHTHIAGNDDGYCNTCGPKRCPYFRLVSSANPTTCKCGHSKRSHVDSY